MFNRPYQVYRSPDEGGSAPAEAAPTADVAPAPPAPESGYNPNWEPDFSFEKIREMVDGDPLNGMNVPYEADKTDDPTPESVEAKPEDAKPADATPQDKKSVTAEGEPAESQVAPGAVAVFTDEQKQVLLDAAVALGIEETDPIKIPEALKAHAVRVAEERQALQSQQDAQAEDVALDRLRQEARDAILGDKGLAVPAIKSEAEAMLRAELGENAVALNTPNWWLSETWEDPEYGPALYTRYSEHFVTAKDSFASRPEWQRAYEQEYETRHNGYAAQKTALDGELAAYKYHNPAIVADARRNGVPAETIKAVAKLTHDHVQTVTSTLNSELAKTQAALTSAQQTIAGHDAAVKQARAEEREAVLAELAKPNPATPGLGNGSAAAPVPRSFEPDWSSPSVWNSMRGQ